MHVGGRGHGCGVDPGHKKRKHHVDERPHRRGQDLLGLVRCLYHWACSLPNLEENITHGWMHQITSVPPDVLANDTVATEVGSALATPISAAHFVCVCVGMVRKVAVGEP